MNDSSTTKKEEKNSNNEVIRTVQKYNKHPMTCHSAECVKQMESFRKISSKTHENKLTDAKKYSDYNQDDRWTYILKSTSSKLASHKIYSDKF